MFRHHDDDKSLHFFFCHGQTTMFMIKNEFKKNLERFLRPVIMIIQAIKTLKIGNLWNGLQVFCNLTLLV